MSCSLRRSGEIAAQRALWLSRHLDPAASVALDVRQEVSVGLVGLV